MRISDWSSDVCSSDLIMTSWRPNCRQASSRAMTGWRCSYEHGRRCGDIVVRHGVHAGAERAGRDRKSVVSGKSVSVRVDLGGRRIIKKKINTDNISSTSYILMH